MSYSGSTGTNNEKIIHVQYSHDMINYSNVSENSILKKLAKKLSVENYGNNYINESIMEYKSICDHDDGYLCEHRLQYIIDFLVKNKDKI